MVTPRQRLRDVVRRGLLRLDRLDQSAYAGIASVRTPALDTGLARLSDAANHSLLWLGTAAALATGSARGRRAAVLGVGAIGLTSATSNLLVKPVLRRARPDRTGAAVPTARHVRMPTSHSFPSGHAASAAAFATTVGHELPWTALPLRLLALAVGYSRVHSGVHYPGDVIAGALLGTTWGHLLTLRADRPKRSISPGSGRCPRRPC
jgi:membrane-associated phospholipid phosphatase